ncbi:MAG: RCC1 domain-containing protein [Pseudobdellovibrionaceae bacterium]
MKHKKNHAKLVSVILSLLILISTAFIFQNCSKGFEVINTETSLTEEASTCGGGSFYGFNIAASCSEGNKVFSPGPLLKFKGISMSSTHACGITMADTLQCWGNNFYGQLGNNSTTDSFVPVDVVGLSGVKTVAADYYSTCALDYQGRVKCWGSSYGELNPTTKMRSSPLPIDLGLSGIKAISGECGITAQDTIKCWDQSQIIDIPNLSAVKALSEHCVITAQNLVKCWDSNLALIDVNDLTDVQFLSGGVSHTGPYGCAITASSKVKCWGSDELTGPSTLGKVVEITGLINIKSLAVSLRHACAITSQGLVKCWGWGQDGELGNNSDKSSVAPVDVVNLGPVKSLAVDVHSSCAITALDTVRCWGVDAFSRMGNNLTTSSDVLINDPLLFGMKEISHNCFVTAQNTVKCRGANSYGQLGNPTIVSSIGFVDVVGLSDVHSLTSGSAHNCVINKLNELKCWGSVGVSTVNSNTPVTFPNLGAVRAVSIGMSGCVATQLGTVKCWGNNYYGQLGNGTTNSSDLPVDVSNLSNVEDISVNLYSACALTSQGEVKCWGQGYGSAGPESNSISTPVDMGLSGIKKISGACAISEQDKVICWNLSFSTFRYSQPKEVLGLNSMKTISVGDFRQYCGLDSQNLVWCWRDDGEAIIGPVKVQSSKPVDAVTLYRKAIYIKHQDGSVSWLGSIAYPSFVPTGEIRGSGI